MIGSGHNQKSMGYVENVVAFLYFTTKLKVGLISLIMLINQILL